MAAFSAEAFEDGVDLQIGLLEAYIPQEGEPWLGYPFPSLKPTAQQEMRTFRTIILENPFLRATLLPGMGGRIISVFDKRTGTEILRRHPMIEPCAGGARGAYVREGIQVLLGDTERLNALGNVSTQLDHATDEQSEAAVWMGETHTGSGLSFHVRISLPPDRCELHFEVRVLNRWFEPQPYNGGLQLYLGDGEFDGNTFYSSVRNVGLSLFSDDQSFDGVRFEDGIVRFSRFPSNRAIAPRQVDTWNLTVIPLSGLNGCAGASRRAAASVSEGMLRVQTTETRLAHKLFLLTRDGQTLEAPVDLYPEHILEVPIGELDPVEMVLRDPSKQEILRATLEGPANQFVLAEGPPMQLNETTLGHESSELELRRATFDVSQRYLAYTLLGLASLRQKEFVGAGVAFEQALAYNADDPLLWWTKAVAARLDEGDNQAELLNAHYLAPLEPALRAESFLAQPVSLDPEPNRLLASLTENPEEFVEVACLLIECGLFDQASRWIDEALRHQNLPMLRYLMAYCLLTATSLEAEALDQVRVAGKVPLAPPFPYRKVERKAINVLFAAFPKDRNLEALSGILAQN